MENVVVKNAGSKGRGMFASRNIKKCERITVIEGPIVKKATVYSIQISKKKHINTKSPARFSNHSCDPNAGIGVYKGQPYLVSIKVIKRGKEILWDYAMSEYTFDPIECCCGNKKCRKIIDGYKNLDKKLKKKYRPYLMPYLKKL